MIAAVFGKPAKSSNLNMISCNGFYGCTKCEQPGESYKAPKKKSNSVVLFKQDHTCLKHLNHFDYFQFLRNNLMHH